MDRIPSLGALFPSQKARSVNGSNSRDVSAYLDLKGTSPEIRLEKIAKLIRVNAERGIVAKIPPYTPFSNTHTQSPPAHVTTVDTHRYARFGWATRSGQLIEPTHYVKRSHPILGSSSVIDEIDKIKGPLFNQYPNTQLVQPLLVEYYRTCEITTSNVRPLFFSSVQKANDALHQALIETIIRNYGLAQNNGVPVHLVERGHRLGTLYAKNPAEAIPEIQVFLTQLKEEEPAHQGAYKERYVFLKKISEKLSHQLSDSTKPYDDVRRFSNALSAWFGKSFAIALIESHDAVFKPMVESVKTTATLVDPSFVRLTRENAIDQLSDVAIGYARDLYDSDDRDAFNGITAWALKEIVQPVLDGNTQISVSINPIRKILPALETLQLVWGDHSPLIGELIQKIRGYPSLDTQSRIRVSLDRSFEQDQLSRKPASGMSLDIHELANVSHAVVEEKDGDDIDDGLSIINIELGSDYIVDPALLRSEFD